MKRIKTLSAISLATTIIGMSMTTFSPAISATTDPDVLYQDSHIKSNDLSPKEDQFDAQHTYATGTDTGYGSTKAGFYDPIYHPENRYWELIQDRTDGQSYGSSTVAFQRPISTSEDFIVSGHPDIH